jgi:hypothetical protein
MRRSLAFALAVTVVLMPAAGSAAVAWKLTKKDGRPYLFALPAEAEADTLFWALCRSSSAIDIGIGGDADVGKGGGEAVKIVLKSGSATATVVGQSRNSANFQMTGTSELRTKVARTHDLFKVLATGRPIAVSGSIKPMTLQVGGLKAMVAAFLTRCK